MNFEKITELRKLMEGATPRPWRVTTVDVRGSWSVVGPAKAPGYEWLTTPQAFDDGSACGEYSATCEEPTRDLIVAAINALPELLDALDDAQGQLDDISSWSGHALMIDDEEHEAPYLPALIRDIVKERDAARAEVERLRQQLAHPPMQMVDLSAGVNWKGISEDLQALRDCRIENKRLIAEVVALQELRDAAQEVVGTISMSQEHSCRYTFGIVDKEPVWRLMNALEALRVGRSDPNHKARKVDP